MKSVEVVRMLHSGGGGVDVALNLDGLKGVKGLRQMMSICTAESRSRVASGPEKLPR